jgi:hypothetical protein
METNQARVRRNNGKLVAQKRLLKPKDLWAIRIHLQNEHQVRDLAMFKLAIDNKLHGCDLVNLRVPNVVHGNQTFPERWSASERPNAGSSSNSPSRPGLPSQHGSKWRIEAGAGRARRRRPPRLGHRRCLAACVPWNSVPRLGQSLR